MNPFSLRSSIVSRMLIVAVLGTVLVIPISLVTDLIQDRRHTRAEAVSEVTEKWGRQQTVTGPILTIPVKRKHKLSDGTIKPYIVHAHFLPDSLDCNAELSPSIRYRGIYRVVLYTAGLHLEAAFSAPALSENESADSEILWSDAFLTLGISDLKGIKDIHKAACEDSPLTPEPGLRTKDLLQAGFTFRTPLSPGQSRFRFVLDAGLNGSEELRFVPLGKTTQVRAQSSWADPSFVGDFLPEERNITDSSFKASWKVLHLNRNLSQSWIGPQPNLESSSFGVKLLLQVDEYQKNWRAVRYAIMFVALTFLAFGMIDVLNRSPFHPVHYTLVGLALVLFFVLLLSVSEYRSFNTSYLVASLPNIFLIGAYTRGVTRRWGVTAVIAGVLVALYGFLFVLLQLEDYALLLGSMGLFVSLSLVMFLTRRIDWFGMGSGKAREEDGPGLPELPLG
ncbi:cell envelope integrity protein CreD [Syntrophobacter fumaroxidans]|uniref:Inner membrane CreD family protein n=1 Tax=Syntrophobacter fumaroxidans (strain DSM 10017 / MPOB) TaxID=335543 RepID=A0LLN0_SYNFM|nr:cell envelope integrity protein CreD [Syntrophobacter fumaroxidans]ABK18332.1 Inner membrane CreD family protein [Syntrophobacter fumaroxidans MPOB]